MVDQIIRPADLPNRANPVASEKVPVDNGVSVGGATIQSIVESGRPAASQSEAEAGANSVKAMTPLTTKQAVDAQVPPKIYDAIADLNLGSAAQANTADFATSAQGNKADSAIQEIVEGANTTVDNTDPQRPIISSSGNPSAGFKSDIVVIDGQADWRVARNYKTVSDLQGDDGSGDMGMGYAGSGTNVIAFPGDIVIAAGFRYEVAPSGATDAHVETAGGVKLYALPDASGVISSIQCGARGGSANSAADQEALNHAFSAAIRANTWRVFADPLPGDNSDTSFYHVNKLPVPSGCELFGVRDKSRFKLLAGDKGDTDTDTVGAIQPSGASNFTIHDILIDGNKDNVTGNNLFNIECLNLNDCSDVEIYNVTMMNAMSDGIDLDGCNNVRIHSSEFLDCEGWGTHISFDSEYCKVHDNIAKRCGSARDRGGFDTFVEAGGNNDIVGNTAIDCTRGYQANGPKTNLSNNRSINSAKTAIGVAGAGCVVSSNIVDGTTTFYGINVTSNGSSITNNTIRNSAQTGIMIDGDDNEVLSNAVSGATVGIQLTSAAERNSIIGNTVPTAKLSSSPITCGNANNDIQSNITGSPTAVGEERLCKKTSSGSVIRGAIVAAADLVFCDVLLTTTGPVSVGTWMALGPCAGSNTSAQMFRRVT